jgi:uncharacterized protein (DUF2236 family)
MAIEPVRWAAHLRKQLTQAEDVGYFGPSSAIWLVNREAVLGLGLGRALLMQIAHPWVAQAVIDHSSYVHRPLDRLLATLAAAELLVFGSRAQADATAAHIRDVHTRVRGVLREDVGRWQRGTPYRADDPDALLWVLVTLADTALLMYESCFGRLSPELERAYLSDAARLGSMIGVPVEMVPHDRLSLEHYIHSMISDGTVAVGDAASHIAQQLMNVKLPPGLGLSLEIWRSVSLAVAISLMPEELRCQYGRILDRWYMPFMRAAGRLGRALLPHLPANLRVDPIAQGALERAEMMGV